MPLRLSFLLVLSASLFACTSETTSPSPAPPASSQPPGSSQSPASGQTASSSSGATPAPSSVYAISCDGQVKKLSSSFELDLAPRCVGGGPDTNCGSGCGAQDVAFSFAPPAANCMPSSIYYWNGTACVAQATQDNDGTLRCSGKDCENIFRTEADCEAHASACKGQ